MNSSLPEVYSGATINPDITSGAFVGAANNTIAVGTTQFYQNVLNIATT